MANKSKTKAIATTKKNEVAAPLDQETLNKLRDNFPADPSAMRIQLPRLSLLSQDKTEESGKGKDKTIKVIEAAGTFFRERQGDEVDEETGKKEWLREELGEYIDGIIVFQRKQLRMYDESTEQYTSSPIFDSKDEVIPLFCDGKEVGRGTPEELKAKYEYTDKKDGKVKSALRDEKILYVLFEDQLYQLNLRSTSMFAYMSYARKVVPPSVVTRFSSEPKEKGDIEWNQMTFNAIRTLDSEEAEKVIAAQEELKHVIAMEKASFANSQSQREDADEKFRKEVEVVNVQEDPENPGRGKRS